MKGKIFNTQEVQAILNRSKVMFREVIKPQPDNSGVYEAGMAPGIGALTNNWAIKQDDKFVKIKCPYGKVGQKIFCKESFWQFGGYDGGSDGDEARFIGSNKITFCPEEAAKPQTLCKSWKKRPAQHMKQEHSRLTLQIKSISVERLGDISEEDAMAEGVKLPKFEHTDETWPTARKEFAKLWNATHKKPEEKFESNCWVWKIEFEVINNKGE